MCKAGKRLLIVEDTNSIAVLVAATLRRAGLCVDVAKTAKEAMTHFVASTEGPISYDLLLVDLNLPDGDGAELLAKMASFDVCPPSFVVSADGSDHARERARVAGASQFFEKPFNLSVLKDAIEDAVSKTAQSEAGRASKKFAAAERGLIDNYLKYLAGLASDLECPLSHKKMSSLLHQLKGSANLYGFNRLSDLTTSLGMRLVEQGTNSTNDIREILRQELLIDIASRSKFASCNAFAAV